MTKFDSIFLLENKSLNTEKEQKGKRGIVEEEEEGNTKMYSSNGDLNGYLTYKFYLSNYMYKCILCL